MRSFDKQMHELCVLHGGSYRRYSDDIAIVLPLGAKKDHVVALVEKVLADQYLSLAAEKTDHASFKNGMLISAKPIQYLGFTFDGQKTLIRESSINAYLRKMRRGIHAKIVTAKVKKHVLSRDVHRRESLSRYTHLGKRRNFLTYAYKAADVMESKDIRQQVKRHMTWFERAWAKEVKRNA